MRIKQWSRRKGQGMKVTKEVIGESPSMLGAIKFNHSMFWFKRPLVTCTRKWGQGTP